MAKKESQRDLAPPSPEPKANAGDKYTVVARRYRPRSFDELIGQQTVAAALKTAIATDRVGHAYLFTGARGVGKTSTARIFAKALNSAAASREGGRDSGAGNEVKRGKAGESEDNPLDIAQLIDRGEDMDVIEIDGASNRGIDEIRQLRSNAAVRPSRSPYKIYIIDEVHMLTLPAFNALLKTLEEPPPHVKFIFCTTNPDKIPITVLSRCQRFDFPPISAGQIQERLAEICQTEGVEADGDALRLLARRANGSMRDSQSLLEQLLSFAGDHLTVDSVHSLLGTADDARLALLLDRLIDRDAAAALRMLSESVESGVDAGQLAEQLLGYFRDLMTLAVGGEEDLLRWANPADAPALRQSAQRWGVMTLLTAIQMLDETLVKMRQSVQSRILLEICFVQICHLQDLQTLANLAEAIRQNAPLPTTLPPRGEPSGEGPTRAKESVAEAAAQKKNVPAVEPLAAPAPAHLPAPAITAVGAKQTSDAAPAAAAAAKPTSAESGSTSSTAADLLELWRAATQACEGILGACASMAVAIKDNAAEGVWEVELPAGSDFAMNILEERENLAQLRRGVLEQTGKQPGLRFFLGKSAPPTIAAIATPAAPRPAMNQSQLVRQVSSHVVVADLMKTLSAEIVKVDPPRQ